MDIIHLLEVLNPLQNVITVKIDSDKGIFATVGDFIIAVAPTVIAGLAMWYSYKQFKSNLNSQSEQFRQGMQLQINALKVSTQLATEVELKKENCKGVREACVQLLSHANDAYTSKVLYRRKVNNLGQEDDSELDMELEDSHKPLLDALKRFREAEYLIETYLDGDNDEAFRESIRELDACIRKDNFTAVENKAAKRNCLAMCQNYIKRQQQEITQLSKSLNN
ncbi:hypothetical protein EY915_03505 [Citrobacter braakii]|uniref:hypothetical protein n=1 Tax=Citrobacter braakii TaxID=57706 RepID=UPI001040156B|nr:hypothetical protein [Citrobacter braakii]TCC85270.1 hypothetical protein EY915_03505 [Citrobacter braakii]